MFKYSKDESEFIQKSGFKNLPFWLATWGGLGLMKPAPGTWGTLGGIPLGMILFLAFGMKGLLIGVIWVAWLGLWASEKLGKTTGVADSPLIVIDEVAGMMLAMIFMGFDGQITAVEMLIGFGLFRFFDVLKPWPISWLDQNIKGGLGVMADDLMAGLFAGIVFIGIANAGFI